MAGKRKEDPEEGRLESLPHNNDPVAEAPQMAATGPPPGDYCILVNLSKSPLACPLRDGRNVNLGPKVRGMTIHRSEPILKKDRTEIMFAWEREGRLAFENLPGGERS